MDNQRRAISGLGEWIDTIEYDPETNTYRASFDSRAESASTAVVSTVAAVADASPLEIESLHSTVDPDSLDTLITRGDSDPSSGEIHVTFSYTGYDVTVHSNGFITVRSPEDGENT